MASPTNILWTSGILTKASRVIELGAGVSGLLSLVLAPRVSCYVATDQDHVLKRMRLNLSRNMPPTQLVQPRKTKSGSKKSRQAEPSSSIAVFGNIIPKSLDWETDDVGNLLSDLGMTPGQDTIDLLVACDCIYNEALIRPFVAACADICELAPKHIPTVCVIAQQLRSSDIFEQWLKEFQTHFGVWRLEDKHLTEDLNEHSGFVVHVGVLYKHLDI